MNEWLDRVTETWPTKGQIRSTNLYQYNAKCPAKSSAYVTHKALQYVTHKVLQYVTLKVLRYVMRKVLWYLDVSVIFKQSASESIK